jgi:GNAT superfamily N-acetyltransferase
MTAPAVAIRVASIADAPHVASLLAELGYPTPADIMAERLRAFIDAGEVALMAFDGAHALGFMSLHMTPVLHRATAVGRITAMIVTETARGQRVGQLLVEAGERWLTERGCALVEVTSNAARTDAHRFYERLGYESTSLRFKKSF